MKMNVVAGLLVMTAIYGLFVEQSDAATVLVTSSPKRAEVTIDGEVRGKTPLRLRLEVGLHDFKLTAADCEPHIGRINVGTQLLRHSVVMKPKTYPVDVMFTDPDEAGWAVFDGKRLMMTGSKLIKLPKTLQLPKGRQQLRFMKPGFKDISIALTVDPAQENQCVELSNKPQQGYSSYGRCRLALVVGKWEDSKPYYYLSFKANMTGAHGHRDERNGRAQPCTYTLEERDDEIIIRMMARDSGAFNERLVSYDYMDGRLRLHRTR